jgi:hypothetical protein
MSAVWGVPTSPIDTKRRTLTACSKKDRSRPSSCAGLFLFIYLFNGCFVHVGGGRDRADEWYELGKAAEKEGDLATAVGHYKRAERLGHSLTDPHPPTQWPEVNPSGTRLAPPQRIRAAPLGHWSRL